MHGYDMEENTAHLYACVPYVFQSWFYCSVACDVAVVVSEIQQSYSYIVSNTLIILNPY